MFEKHELIWYRISNTIGKKKGKQLVYIEKYLNTKLKLYNDKIKTYLQGKKPLKKYSPLFKTSLVHRGLLWIMPLWKYSFIMLVRYVIWRVLYAIWWVHYVIWGVPYVIWVRYDSIPIQCVCSMTKLVEQKIFNT